MNNSALITYGEHSDNPITGSDQSGKVLYADYSTNTSTYYLSKLIGDFNAQKPSSYGIISKYNDLYETYCSIMCTYDQYHGEREVLYKTGTVKQH